MTFDLEHKCCALTLHIYKKATVISLTKAPNKGKIMVRLHYTLHIEDFVLDMDKVISLIFR